MSATIGQLQGKEEQNLSEIYDRGCKSYTDIENSNDNTNSENIQAKTREAMAGFEQATRMVSELNLFSTNEELSEVTTLSLRYLLLPAYLGDLTLKKTSCDSSARRLLVEAAKTYYIDFLKRCASYGIFTGEIPSEDSSRMVESRSSSSRAANIPAMEFDRRAKIEQYKKQRETEKRLTEMGSASDISSRDEETQREYYTLLLNRWTGKAVEELKNIEQELQILSHMQKMQSQRNENPAAAAAAQSLPGSHPQPSPRQPMKPFVLTKDKVQAAVFGAGYPSVPTMTLEEFFQKEVREGKVKLGDRPSSHQMSEREEAEKKEAEKELLQELDDPETLKKARDWDDWKDDNPRGSGNTMNRS